MQRHSLQISSPGLADIHCFQKQNFADRARCCNKRSIHSHSPALNPGHFSKRLHFVYPVQSIDALMGVLIPAKFTAETLMCWQHAPSFPSIRTTFQFIQTASTFPCIKTLSCHCYTVHSFLNDSFNKHYQSHSGNSQHFLKSVFCQQPDTQIDHIPGLKVLARGHIPSHKSGPLRQNFSTIKFFS